MTNMLDYIAWRGDLSFVLDPVNEIDNLIFSTLAYLHMDDLIAPEEKITIEELYSRYKAAGEIPLTTLYDPAPLLTAAAASRRFRNVICRDYESITDEKTHLQFSAVIFEIGAGTVFAAFRGTDFSMTGWREDFYMTTDTEIPAHRTSVDYLNRTCGRGVRRIYAGGHSKGGNLAVYAGAFSSLSIRRKIRCIYSNDGPGFLDNILHTKEMQRVFRKTVHIVPENSIIGLLLPNQADPLIVRTSKKVMESHDPYSWNVKGNTFERAEELAAVSVFMIDVFNRWLSSISDEKRKMFIDTIFDACIEAGIKSTLQLHENPVATYSALLSALNKTDPEMKKLVSDLVVQLGKTGSGAFVEEIMKVFHKEKNE